MVTNTKRSVATFIQKCFVLHSDLRDFDYAGLDDYDMAIVEGLFEILHDGLQDASWKLREVVDLKNSNNRNWNAVRNVTRASLISDATAASELGYELLDALDAAGADATEEILDLIENIPDILAALPSQRGPKRLPPFASLDAVASAILEVLVREISNTKDQTFHIQLEDVSSDNVFRIHKYTNSQIPFAVSVDDEPAEIFNTKQELINHLRTTQSYKSFLKTYAKRILDIGKQMGNVSLMYKISGEPFIRPEDGFQYICGTFTHYYDQKQRTLQRSLMATRRRDDLVNERTRNLFEQIRRVLGLLHPDDVLY